jgi:hypothetical protein
MIAGSLERSTLDPVALMQVRIAALVAVDAPRDTGLCRGRGTMHAVNGGSVMPADHPYEPLAMV